MKLANNTELGSTVNTKKKTASQKNCMIPRTERRGIGLHLVTPKIITTYLIPTKQADISVAGCL